MSALCPVTECRRSRRASHHPPLFHRPRNAPSRAKMQVGGLSAPLIDVRYGAHSGPKSDVAPSLLCAKTGPSSNVAFGSVEVWRGSFRFEHICCRPFRPGVPHWFDHCPFSHPAHRTGQADLSGSSAIAGFRPHRTHRAALPQWALQKGPEASRSLPPCLVDHRFR
jgi:hypothetical protein